MKNVLLIASILLGAQVVAQDFSRKFGAITQDEIELQVYEKDPEAEALVLYDIGESFFYKTDEGGFDIRFTHSKKIKIFKRSGIDYADISIPFYVDGYGKTEKIVSIQAHTYTLKDGGIKRKSLDPSTIYEEQINERWRVKKFVFPDVQEGSVIEYKYVLETPFHFNLPDWTFQDRIPTLYSKYTGAMIPFYEYVYLLQGITQFDYQNSELTESKRTWGTVVENYGQNIGSGIEFQDYVHTFVLEDIPAFKDESYITSPDDYLIKMDFQLSKFHRPTGGTEEIITTWPELNKELLKNDNFGKYLNQSERIAKKVLKETPNLVTDNLNQLQKCEALINYVKNAFTWNGYYGKYASKSAKDFFKQKTGSAAEINLFLTALLNAADVKADPVIISTRNHGKIKTNYPFSHFFNYVIVFVEGSQPFLADGTDATIGFSRIPPRCINENGLIVKKDEVNWVQLESSVISLNNKAINLEIDPSSNKAVTSLTLQTSEYEAYRYKKAFGDEVDELKEYLAEHNINNVDALKTFNFGNNNKPYIIACRGESKVETLSNKIIVSPFLNFPLQENKLTQKKRTYPVDFIYAKSESFKSSVNIPEGYKVLPLPENFTLSNDLIDISLVYAKQNTLISVTGTYTFKKPMYEASEYTKIKEYFDIIVDKFNKQIVLEQL